MLPNLRRNKILEIIREDGSTRVLDLARILKVKEVTIRLELEKVLITWEHCGAYLKIIQKQAQTNSPALLENLDKEELVAKKMP